MQLHLIQRFRAYTWLWQPVGYAIWYFLENILGGLYRLGDRTFATWHSSLGHCFAQIEEMTPVPRLVGFAKGITLEVGPGSGVQLPRFDRAKVSKIYGVEPNAYLCGSLSREAIPQNHLDDIYVLVNGTVEDERLLESKGIAAGTVDSVVCMQVLCSVADPAAAARSIYKLLKPGGQLLFWEHETSRDKITRVVQEAWNILWTPLIGGCHLGREIERAVVSAGQWEIVEFGRNEGQPYTLLPRVWGRFVKPEA